MLTVGPEPDKFSVQKREEYDYRRGGSMCMVNYKGETCFVINGSDLNILP